MSKLEQLGEAQRRPQLLATYSGDTSPEELRAKLLDAIAQSAFTNLRTYSNCSRSTLRAVQEHLETRCEGTVPASVTLAGGIGGTGETCGTVLGALMAIGEALGPDSMMDSAQDARAKAAARAFVVWFNEEYGGTRCFQVQDALVGWHCDEASKVEAWQEAGGPTGCALVCGEAARTAARLILEEWDSYEDS